MRIGGVTTGITAYAAGSGVHPQLVTLTQQEEDEPIERLTP
jgi:hypothetical protein